MTETKDLPKQVTLGGILYNITEVEGLIVFSEAMPMAGLASRFSFHRSPEHTGMWYLQLNNDGINVQPHIALCHVERAAAIVRECRGDDHPDA